MVAGGGLWNSGNATLSNTIVEFNRANGALPNGSAYGVAFITTTIAWS